MFIALEGGDGAGKSSQLPLLQAWLENQGKKVTQCREPGSTRLGERIRELLLFAPDLGTCRTSELLLFMAARAQLVQSVVRPALERGEVVLADRFLLSSIVYQGYAGGLAIEEIRQLGRIATGGILPDLNIILDLPLSLAKKRRKEAPDRLEAEADAFHERVRNGFLMEANLFPETNVVVSASQSIDEVHEKIRRAILPFLK